MQFKMFHRPKPKKSAYKPIYYKEEEEKPTKWSKSADTEELDRKKRFEEQLRNEKPNVRNRKSISITIYLVIIILLCYFIFFA